MGTLTPLRALVCAALIVLSYCLMPEAHAGGSGGWPPPPVTGGGTETPTPGGGSGPTTPGTPTPAPEGQRWVSGSIPLSEDVHNFAHPLGGEGSQTISGYCPPVKVAPGVIWYATGASWTYLVDEETGAYAGGFAFWCWMPPAPESSVVTCVVGLDGRGERVRLTGKVYDTHKVRTAWSSNTTSVANCNESAAQIAVRAPMETLGAFRVTVDGITRSCTRWDFPGTSRPSIIKGCGPRQTGTTEARGSVYCTPGRIAYALGPNSWRHNSYNPDACLAADSTGASCVTPPASEVRFNGRATRGRIVEGFKDGRDNTVRFGAFRTRGIANVRKVYSTLTIGADSSPVRDGETVNGPTQPFIVEGAGRFSDEEGADWTAGVPASHTARWMSAGVAGKPFTMSREVTFTGDLVTRTVAITGLNFLTGEATTQNITRTITLDNLSCHSAEVAVDLTGVRLSN